MDRLLSDDIVSQLRQVFQELKEPVQVLLFVSQDRQDISEITQKLLEELVVTSEKLSLVVHDIDAEPELAAEYKVVGKAPALVIAAKDGETITDYGIRYLGVPSGHEFSTLIQDLILVSGRDSGLSEQLRTYVRALQKPVHLQVFVTPT